MNKPKVGDTIELKKENNVLSGLQNGDTVEVLEYTTEYPIKRVGAIKEIYSSQGATMQFTMTVWPTKVKLIKKVKNG